MREGVLFITSCKEDAANLSEMLNPLSIPLVHAQDLRRAHSYLDRESFGVILTEAELPDGSWEDVMQWSAQPGSCGAVIVTHPLADARFWADVLDLGAYDLLPQPFCCSEVQRIVTNALSAPPEFRKFAHTAL